MKPSGILTLITDFGTEDAYVAVMKGVILRRAPELRIVDITHQIPPQDLRRAGFILAESAPWFPPGTVHVVVVDPGVGTERAGLVLETSDQLVVAPDNGVISELMDRSGAGHCYSLDRPELGLEPRSRTFHGRDLFAPAAASLASGKVEPSACGEPLDPIWHRRCSLLLGERSVMGSVVSVDHFGNLITDISREYLPDSWPREVAVAIGSREIDAVVETYAQAEVGTLVALLGSGDRVEISRVEGSAAEFLDQRLGARVHLRW